MELVGKFLAKILRQVRVYCNTPSHLTPGVLIHFRTTQAADAALLFFFPFLTYLRSPCKFNKEEALIYAEV